MAYAHKVVRVTLFGTMFNGQEEWSTGFFMGATGADAEGPASAFGPVVKTAWQTFFSAASTQIYYTYNTLGVKLALMGTDGKTVLDSVVTDYYTTPPAGNYRGVGHPPQCALVASLIADSGKGLGGKGRMFLPGVAFPVNANGHIEDASVSALATNLQAFFNTLNGSFDAPGTLINASQGRVAIGGTAPINRVVTSLKVGNVYDTQRRRRNALAEVYQSKAIA